MGEGYPDVYPVLLPNSGSLSDFRSKCRGFIGEIIGLMGKMSSLLEGPFAKRPII